jgi:hypothetical protein
MDFVLGRSFCIHYHLHERQCGGHEKPVGFYFIFLLHMRTSVSLICGYFVRCPCAALQKGECVWAAHWTVRNGSRTSLCQVSPYKHIQNMDKHLMFCKCKPEAVLTLQYAPLSETNWKLLVEKPDGKRQIGRHWARRIHSLTELSPC